MKLTFHQMYYHLKKEFDIKRLSCNSSKIWVEWPIFYKKGEDLSGHLVLIRKEQLEEIEEESPFWKSCVFICFGEADDTYCRRDTDLLVVDDSSREEEVLNSLQKIFQYFNSFEYSIQEIFLNNQNFSDLITCCEAVFELPLALVDANFSFVAYTKGVDEAKFVKGFVNDRNALPIHLAGKMLSDPSYKQSTMLKSVYTYTLEQVMLQCKNLFVDETYIGKLMTPSVTTPLTNEYHRDLLILAADFIQRMYERYGSYNLQNHSLDSLHEALSLKLQGGACPLEKWNNALKDTGWKTDDPLLFIELRPDYRYDKTLYETYLCREMERQWPGSCCVEEKQKLVMLMNASLISMEQFRKEFPFFLRENLLTAGISRAFAGPEELSAAYRQAELAFEFGGKKDPTSWIFRFDDYALSILLERGIGTFLPHQICAPELLLLIKHDEELHTEYYKTLFAYVKCRYNAAQTAKELYIHRSTFLNRLERMTEITQMKLDEFQARLFLELSFCLLEGY